MAHWMTDIRGRVPAKALVVLGVVPIVLLIGLWWFFTLGEVEERAIGPQILPSPLEVARSVPDLFKRNLLTHVLASLERVGLGYLVALIVVLPLGVLMGAFGSARAMFSPASTASGYIPIATLVPLTMSWFGTDERQKVIFLAMAFGIYLLPLIVSAVDNVPGVYLRTAATLGASKTQTVFRVLVPIAMPEIWRAMRLGFGVGWTYLVLTEVVVLTDGLGYLVAISQRQGPREHIYLVIVVIALIAWASDLAWTSLGRWLFPYYERSRK
jgi:ABC-type nitrate/sulfonate/bicarbonate transport system permease component